MTDYELLQVISQDAFFISGLPSPGTGIEDAFGKNSAIQPASVDLHVGEISIPGSTVQEESTSLTSGDFTLMPGNTAVVTTKELLRLPKDIAGIGFPPSHLSVKGLLMTNPGHIDPGYAGSLHLTVINMSRTPIPLRCDDAIVTVVFDRLDKPCRKGYSERTGPSSVNSDAAKRLSPDFLDVTNRATDIANRAVSKASIYASLIAVAVTLLSTVLPYYFDTKKDIAILQEQTKSLSDDLKETRTKLEALEKQSNGVAPGPR